MTEATWGDSTKTPAIDWTMSAAIEDVIRGDSAVPEVTSLRGAVRAWMALDADGRAAATLTPEHPILIDGVSHETLVGDAIAALAERLPS